MDELYVLLFLIGMIVSITFLGMATFAYKKGSGRAKRRYIVSGVFAIIAVLGILGIARGLPDKDTLETAETTSAKVDYNNVAITVDDQFQKYIQELEPFELSSVDVINNFHDNKIDRLSAYEKIRDMKDRYTVASMEINRVSIPEDLPEELKNDLEKLQMDIATNYFTRSEAMKHFLNYIDSGKISDIDKMNQQLEASASFAREIKLNYGLFYSKVGLPPTEE
ncbi:hypothetical protein [Paenibacillus xylanilyticus]|uniref:Uncharacterized protein n=1 Tax=Paenibacillus xylanilyticus TaxID=248903 RepID=A0A7Y6ETS5_9BACL|nr:hypothetical protein [Paenibacillus xylanilyticus]NUU73974.1 hypothetical protein [Paenibacillus xylanilyticus]